MRKSPLVSELSNDEYHFSWTYTNWTRSPRVCVSTCLAVRQVLFIWAKQIGKVEGTLTDIVVYALRSVQDTIAQGILPYRSSYSCKLKRHCERISDNLLALSVYIIGEEVGLKSAATLGINTKLFCVILIPFHVTLRSHLPWQSLPRHVRSSNNS